MTPPDDPDNGGVCAPEDRDNSGGTSASEPAAGDGASSTPASGDGEVCTPEGDGASGGAETAQGADSSSGGDNGGVCTPEGDGETGGTASEGDQTQAGGGGSADLEVKLRVFIPCRAVQPFSLTGRRAFAGDDRGFSYSAGTSRAEIVGTLRIGGGGSIVSRAFGRSEEYKYDDVVHVAGKPDWFYDLKPGFTLIASDTQTVTNDRLFFTGGTEGDDDEDAFSKKEGTTPAKLLVDGALPLMAGAPAIDADLFVHARTSGGRVQAAVRGKHDGFPAYEIYINQKLVYSYDPVAAGASPSALLPPEDVTASTGFVDLGPAP